MVSFKWAPVDASTLPAKDTPPSAAHLDYVRRVVYEHAEHAYRVHVYSTQELKKHALVGQNIVAIVFFGPNPFDLNKVHTTSVSYKIEPKKFPATIWWTKYLGISGCTLVFSGVGKGGKCILNKMRSCETCLMWALMQGRDMKNSGALDTHTITQIVVANRVGTGKRPGRTDLHKAAAIIENLAYEMRSVTSAPYEVPQCMLRLNRGGALTRTMRLYNMTAEELAYTPPVIAGKQEDDEWDARDARMEGDRGWYKECAFAASLDAPEGKAPARADIDDPAHAGDSASDSDDESESSGSSDSSVRAGASGDGVAPIALSAYRAPLSLDTFNTSSTSTSAIPPVMFSGLVAAILVAMAADIVRTKGTGMMSPKNSCTTMGIPHPVLANEVHEFCHRMCDADWDAPTAVPKRPPVSTDGEPAPKRPPVRPVDGGCTTIGFGDTPSTPWVEPVVAPTKDVVYVESGTARKHHVPVRNVRRR